MGSCAVRCSDLGAVAPGTDLFPVAAGAVHWTACRLPVEPVPGGTAQSVPRAVPAASSAAWAGSVARRALAVVRPDPAARRTRPGFAVRPAPADHPVPDRPPVARPGSARPAVASAAAAPRWPSAPTATAARTAADRRARPAHQVRFGRQAHPARSVRPARRIHPGAGAATAYRVPPVPPASAATPGRGSPMWTPRPRPPRWTPRTPAAGASRSSSARAWVGSARPDRARRGSPPVGSSASSRHLNPGTGARVVRRARLPGRASGCSWPSRCRSRWSVRVRR